MEGNARNQQLLIRVGYHKTGNKWFQGVFFDEDPRFQAPFSYWEIVGNLAYPNSLHFDPESARAFFEPGLKAAWEAGRFPVLSAERLVGNPYSGGYDSKEIAERLDRVFPRASIWVVIRNQVDAIASNYKQYVHENGTASLGHFLKGDPPERIPSFDFRYFEYDHLIKHYRKLFGPDRVLVSLYEDMVVRPQSFVDALYSFVGLEPYDGLRFSMRLNASFSDTSVAMLRPLNFFSYYPSMAHYPLVNLRGRRHVRWALRRFDRVLGDRISKGGIERRVKRIVGDRYAESNRRLGELLGVDLGARGYVV